jgi:hypothetical protein
VHYGIALIVQISQLQNVTANAGDNVISIIELTTCPMLKICIPPLSRDVQQDSRRERSAWTSPVQRRGRHSDWWRQKTQNSLRDVKSGFPDIRRRFILRMPVACEPHRVVVQKHREKIRAGDLTTMPSSDGPLCFSLTSRRLG